MTNAQEMYYQRRPINATSESFEDPVTHARIHADYGHYIVYPPCPPDRLERQPGDLHYNRRGNPVWVNSTTPVAAAPYLNSGDIYQRAIPVPDGHRLLELDEVVREGDRFMWRDTIAAGRFGIMPTEGAPGETVKDAHRGNRGLYMAFFRPKSVEIPDTPDAAWRPVAEFDKDQHLPCWVTDGEDVDMAVEAYGRHSENSVRGRPMSMDQPTSFDQATTLFIPIPRPHTPSPRSSFEVWWDGLAEKPTMDKETARAIWESACGE